MQFIPFPKLARFNRDIVITEKLDGTNSQIIIDYVTMMQEDHEEFILTEIDGLGIMAGSRNRYITPNKDNFGFARWVQKNAVELMGLGVGRHFGEWWGQGIQRGYGLEERRFSLFNTSRWVDNPDLPACCSVVPVLYQGPMNQQIIDDKIADLIYHGSPAAPGFMDPEGIVVFHTAANAGFKITCKNDEKPKSQV